MVERLSVTRSFWATGPVGSSKETTCRIGAFRPAMTEAGSTPLAEGIRDDEAVAADTPAGCEDPVTLTVNVSVAVLPSEPYPTTVMCAVPAARGLTVRLLPWTEAVATPGASLLTRNSSLAGVTFWIRTRLDGWNAAPSRE